ncbi:MAG TPA: PadR family transcriptional regulator [Vicinamibacterales bacterium]|nr:PadR family transcriptional regulator [Vicinamibacterales bacterium]
MPKDSDRSGDRSAIGSELRRGSLELVVLHVLAPAEAYGYEIVTMLASRTDGVLAVTDGTLYPVLYRLERAGLVAVRWETPERGVPRKYYRLTDAGRAELERLRHEWNTFVTAMAQLLANEEGK